MSIVSMSETYQPDTESGKLKSGKHGLEHGITFDQLETNSINQ